MFILLSFGALLYVRATVASNELNPSVSESMDASQDYIVDANLTSGVMEDNNRQHFEYVSDMWLALAALNLSEKNLIDFNTIDGKEENIQNIRTTVLFFTRYCGPGSRLWNKLFKSDERTYMDVDFCCKMHDECPQYVEKFDDYNRYPGLEFRPQFFSRFVTRKIKLRLDCLESSKCSDTQHVWQIHFPFCFILRNFPNSLIRASNSYLSHIATNPDSLT